MVKISELKTDPEGFNNLPDRKTMTEALKGLPIEFVDTDREWWKNTDDTMVFRVVESQKDLFETGLDIGIFASSFMADEFDYITMLDGSCVVRLWWD